MEIIFYPFVALVLALLIFVLIEQPYYIGGIILFMVLYQFNLPTPLPLDSRGILTLLLFTRLYFFDKDNLIEINKNLLTSKYFWIVLAFISIILIVPIINSDKIIGLIKDIILAIVNLILGHILVKNKAGRSALLFGIIIAGIFSSIDLIYTFFTTGSLHIIKLLDLMIGREPVLLNHNYPGFLASMGLMVVYIIWYKTKIKKPLLSIIGAIFSIGIIISTSRSSILALLGVILFATAYEEKLKHNLKKIIPAVIVLGMFLVLFFFTYNIFLVNQTQVSYLDKIYYRLYEEPYEMITGKASDFDKLSGQRIKGSMTFRAERWQEDFEKFTELDLFKQIFGLGPKGYLEIAEKVYKKSGYFRNQLAAHNGYLLILLERGILGLVLFILLVTSLSIKTFKNFYYFSIPFPMIYLLLMLLIYSFAQNSELTSPYTYLFIGSVIGNLNYSILAGQIEGKP